MKEQATGNRTLTLVLVIVVVGLLNVLGHVAREMKAGAGGRKPA